MYLNATKDLKANLPRCYVDASYTVHRLPENNVTNNIATKSSTEAEIVGVSDGTGENLGLMYLIEEQGYNVQPIILYQDNTSAITLMTKGKSASQRNKHKATRYIFVKDRIELGEIMLAHMGTKNMIAYLYTKPVQGELFRCMRDKIMGGNSLVNL